MIPMYTAEDIRNITFTKSLGGYKTGEVDDFIDICVDTVEELTKTNADLKKKMELLANKVVEYRNDEDSIRTALLSAQRMGDTVLREANHKAGLILEKKRHRRRKTPTRRKRQNRRRKRPQRSRRRKKSPSHRPPKPRKNLPRPCRFSALTRLRKRKRKRTPARVVAFPT